MKKDNRLTSSNCAPMAAEHQPILRDKLAERGVLVGFNDEATPLESAIVGTANCLYEFFHSNGYIILRDEWNKKTIVSVLASYEGWVYAFYDKDDSPLYVGETGRTFIERFNEHNGQLWWPYWDRVKVLPCPKQSTRKVFESLIGLAGGYLANRLQPMGADNIFDDVVLSLLLLGNDTNARPTFPNKMLFDEANKCLAQLPLNFE